MLGFHDRCLHSKLLKPFMNYGTCTESGFRRRTSIDIYSANPLQYIAFH